MGRQDGRPLTDPSRALRTIRGSEPAAAQPGAAPLDRLLADCEVLMSDVGEASMRAVAARALAAYKDLDDGGKLAFFTHIAKTYDVDADRVRAAYGRWDAARAAEAGGEAELTALFDAVEPARQQLLRQMNHAPDATLALVEMRADLRRHMPGRPDLRALDHDFHHLLKSWFNRGFLHLEEVTWDSPPELHRHLLRYERVHPMADGTELRRRLEPVDRSVHAFFHPATDVPLIFVEVALTRGIPAQLTPLLAPGPALHPADADTAVLYSINNSLDGLSGISFGSLLIKQVIEQVGKQFPHLETFATLSPIPGFRAWLDSLSGRDEELRALAADLAAIADQADPGAAEAERIRPRLLDALTRYIAVERREDGRPVDPVARFHLGNGAAAWRLNWPANPSSEAWRQSYGAMINYRYEPEHLVRRHEDFMRRNDVALGGSLRNAVLHSARAAPQTTEEEPRR